MFDILVACTKRGGIGKDGAIPWYLPPDLKYFRTITMETAGAGAVNAVIMGRNTWYSLPKRPLAGRLNVVLSSSMPADVIENITAAGAHVCRSLEEALAYLKGVASVEKVFVIGGGRLYAEAIDHPECENVYVTMIENEYDCDTFFPLEKLERETNDFMISSRFTMVSFTFGFRYKDIRYEFRKYERVAND